MQTKSNIGGFTLVELLIAVTLLSMVLAAAYYLLAFTSKSYNQTVAQYEAEQDARKAMKSLEADIRKAKAIKNGAAPHKAVEVGSSGMQVNIYTNIDKDDTLELVQYKLEDNKLKRGEAELGSTPTSWTTMANRIYNNTVSPKVPIFSIKDEQINIDIIVGDESNHLKEDPVSIQSSVTVRSKGAME